MLKKHLLKKHLKSQINLKSQVKMDEFALVLLAGVILIGILMVGWTTPLEILPTVSPLSVSLSASNGTSTSFVLNVSGKVTNVTLSSAGEIERWISFSKKNFDFISEYVLATVSVSVPKTASARTYSGTIIVKSTGGEKAIPVSVEVSTIRTLSSRSIPLGDFTVSYTAGTKILDSKESTSISKGYFSEKSINLLGIVDDRDLPIVTGGYLQLVVDDTNQLGNLIVVLNDKEIFNQKVGIGETSIPIDATLIKKSNVVSIKSGDPGFVFWSSSVYNFRIVKFTISFKGAFSKEIPFTLNPDEFGKFDHFQLSFRVKDYSVSLPQLSIKINDQTVFKSIPETVVFNRNFEKDIFGNSIILKENSTISFSFDKEAYYDTTDATLTIFYGA